MLTGDNATTARAVAAKLGIAEVEAEVLPEDKSRIVERLRREGRVAAGVLYPFLGLLLSPMLAAAAMSLSSVCVIAKALRLGTVRLSDA